MPDDKYKLLPRILQPSAISICYLSFVIVYRRNKRTYSTQQKRYLTIPLWNRPEPRLAGRSLALGTL
jgi:hypothetical protein